MYELSNKSDLELVKKITRVDIEKFDTLIAANLCVLVPSWQN